MTEMQVAQIAGKTGGGGLTFWETDLGGNDFNGAESLCHGWAAIPIYFYFA